MRSKETSATATTTTSNLAPCGRCVATSPPSSSLVANQRDRRPEAAPLSKQCARSRQVREMRPKCSKSQQHRFASSSQNELRAEGEDDEEKTARTVQRHDGSKHIPEVTFAETTLLHSASAHQFAPCEHMVGHFATSGGSIPCVLTNSSDALTVSLKPDHLSSLTSSVGSPSLGAGSLSPPSSGASSIHSLTNSSGHRPHHSLPCPESHTRKNSGQKSVKLLVEPIFLEEIDLPASKDDYVTTSFECHPFAVLLRFSVVQIVCGIVTVLLGVVAIFEAETRYTLGLGIPTGVLTVMASVSRIQAAQKLSSGRRLSSTYPFTGLFSEQSNNCSSDPSTDMELGPRTRRLFDLISAVRKKSPFLRPLSPTFACLLSAFLLLTLAILAAGANSTHNSFVLGLLLAMSAFTVIIVELVAWALTLHWMADYLQQSAHFRSRRASSLCRPDDTF